ncbi:hypothetical protein TRFO_40682 [Tritrichomonas foetus]|uniref:Response regulatory domain-containing protein n=1 Tax=Tritrichomonas foetus TaxID=1144522 RepID=A0A1J4J2P7_9EUKA|nr:hypothetical protein TRFO_40682 [Tritrichomonas foetus]|eukprot:OHS93009.1 hypothetical protein TRFO_40682 [Tritrichomonas foetus]
MAKNSFCHQNFEEAFHEMCLLTGASCAFCYENDILDYSFYKNDISHLSADILNSIPLLIKNEMISYIEPNLVPVFDLCFVICDYDQWRNKKCVIVYPNSMSIEMFTRTGVPIAAKFCLFLYDISRAKQLHLKFHNFLELLACTNHFAFIEFTRDLKNILCFKMSSDISINNEILDSKDVQYFLNSKHFSNEEDYEFMINYYKSEEYKESFISQKIIEVTSYPFHWTSNCLSSVFDINLGKHVVSLLVEDISDITNKDQKYLAEMNDIEQASKILDLHKFIIKENGVFLLDNKIFEKLHVDPNDRSLKNILSDSDQKKIEYLKYPSKFTISLIDSSKNLLWYSAMSNGYFGFLYCVNEFIEQRKESQKKQNSRAYSHKICMWSVNQNSDKVLKLFDFPSIWDLLTVDANKKFIHFADFVRPDKRNLLLNKYHDIVSLNIDSWTIKVPLIQIGGSYKWYRIHFTRAKNNRIYCIAHDINEIKIKDDRKKILLSHKNHLLKDFNVMIWTFEDTYDKYNIKNTLFEPGITAYLRMNWWFANKYIDKAELEIFREKMQKAIKSSLYFECIVTLNFDKSYHVLLQGKSGSVISGFCINIDNIWHENDQMKQKVDLIRKQNMKRTKKKSLMKECNTLSKLSCIYGGLDLLSAKSFNSWQEWIIELFRYMSNKITEDTYCYIYSPSSFNILDTIEHLMHIMHFYCDEKKIELEVRIDGLFPERIYEKKEPLNFLLFSFVNNFLNYTPEYSKLLIHFKWIISIPNNCEFFKIKISSDQKIKIPELSLACIEMKPVIDQSNSKLSLQLNGISYPYKRIKSKPKYVICCNDDPINRQIIQQFEDYGTAYTLISKNNLNTFLSTMEHVKAFFVDDIDAKHMIEQRYIHPCIYYICEPIYQSHEPLHIYKPVVSAQIRKLLCSIKGSSGIINVFKPSIHLESIVRYVLLVEMNVDEQYILAKMLESIQCSFYIARNGDESISALEKFKFDIIFMDCDLPFSEGLSLTKMIRLLPKRYSCIPIIGISADISIEQESLLVGMNAFYPKPIRIHSIKDALTRFSH